MRILMTAVGVAGALTVVACDRPAETANDMNTSAAEAAQNEGAEATAAAAPAAAASWEFEPGTYEYSRSDGRTGVNTVKADSTYSNAIKGGKVETGTWSTENGLSCLVSDDGGEKRCYTFTKPDADGNFTGSLPDGMTITVRKTG